MKYEKPNKYIYIYIYILNLELTSNYIINNHLKPKHIAISQIINYNMSNEN